MNSSDWIVACVCAFVVWAVCGFFALLIRALSWTKPLERCPRWVLVVHWTFAPIVFALVLLRSIWFGLVELGEWAKTTKLADIRKWWFEEVTI